MVFSTSSFLFLFFPITLIVYYLIPKIVRNAYLFLVSLIFYAWGGADFLRILLVSLVWNYLTALIIEKFRDGGTGKAVLGLTLAGNIGILVYFKYLRFFADIFSSLTSRTLSVPEVLLPIGISFFTFQAISYAVEVYRGESALKNPLDLGMYITFFPQLIAGPIVRYPDIKRYIHDRKANLQEITDGFERFLIGLCKKVVLANPLGLIADEILSPIDYSSDSVLLLWIRAIAFSLQIYYDFSGYSDMAIGLGHMFGFTFPENFIYPYCADSIKDFWKRWHISLSAWFRDYVYIPLGGSRKGSVRHILNLLAVWALSGLWHGAAWTFVIWGLIYFVLLSLEKYVIKPERFTGVIPKVLYRVFTLACIVCAWAIFKTPSLTQAREFLLAMMGMKGLPLCNNRVLFVLRNNKVLFPAAVLFCMPVVPYLRSRKTPVVRTCYYAVLLLALLLAIASIFLDAYNPFLYFQF